MEKDIFAGARKGDRKMEGTVKPDTGRKISVMGLVNLTADSYYASSRCLGKDGSTDVPAAVGMIGRMFGEGADIVDIGACSTRPGASVVSAQEEWRRLAPLMEVLRKEFPGKTFSIDTFRAETVKRCFDSIGDFIVNDISAGEDSPDMLGTVGQLSLTYIAMHKRGTPDTMQNLCSYEDVVTDVLDYFRAFGRKAAEAGIKDWILDPGFGFAKTCSQNYSLLASLGRFMESGKKILVGVSRKSMIYRKFGIQPEDALPQTQVLHFAALQNGADILRVHDVAEAVRTVETYRMLTTGQSTDRRQ